MEIIFNEIFRAIGYLVISLVVFIAYKYAKDNAKNSNKKIILWKGLLWCSAIALFASLTLGNPTCSQVADPVFGGCEEYDDNSYEPTTEERVANFAYFMTLLYIPVIAGILHKKDIGSFKNE